MSFDIDLPGAGVCHHAVVGGTRLLSGRHSVVNVLDDGPTSLGGDLAQFLELEADILALSRRGKRA